MGLMIDFSTTEVIQSPVCGVLSSQGGDLAIRFGAQYIYVNYQAASYVNTHVSRQYPLNNRTVISIDEDHSIYVAGEIKGQFERTEDVQNLPIYIFKANTASSYRISKLKLYHFSLFDQRGVVLNLKPVRKDGVGYMYDTVSGQLFGNSGTGAFILGPDV